MAGRGRARLSGLLRYGRDMDAALAPPRLHPMNTGFVWQDSPRDGLRRLTTEQVDQFNADGFFIYRGAFTPQELAAVTAAIDPL